MAICERYNDFKERGYYIKFDTTALQILQLNQKAEDRNL